MSALVVFAQMSSLTLLPLQGISPRRKNDVVVNSMATTCVHNPSSVERASLTPASQIDAATQKDGGFKFTAINGAPSQKEPQHMALLAMELHSE